MEVCGLRECGWYSVIIAVGCFLLYTAQEGAVDDSNTMRMFTRTLLLFVCIALVVGAVLAVRYTDAVKAVFSDDTG